MPIGITLDAKEYTKSRIQAYSAATWQNVAIDTVTKGLVVKGLLLMGDIDGGTFQDVYTWTANVDGGTY